ncbi:MAG TPA: NAD(P)-dependent oxidoreductase [Thermomicrobiaceae bacterium]|nr:NAD(P)-dependent oxidoreductase [Thermomicrobiaceae bacterium]
MAVLVTGVGYIGARLVERLLAAGEEVVAVENGFSTDAAAVAALAARPGCTLIEGDAAEPAVLEAAFSAAPIATVYALASQASAHPEAASPSYTERANLVAPRVVLDAMLAHSVTTIVYASSFRVYGDALPPLVDESLPYGRFGDLSHLSKVYAEKLLELYAARHGLTALSLRLGICYGPSPVMKRDARFMTAPNKFCRQAAQGEPLLLYSDCDRPAGFIHVDDAAGAMLAAAAEPLSGYLPLNAVTEMRSVAQLAQDVRRAGEERGFHVAVCRQAPPGPPPGEISVRSRLPRFFAQPRRTLAGSVGELIDYWSHA